MPFYCGKRSAGTWVVLDPQEILDVLQRIRLQFLGTCGFASANSSLCLATMAYTDDS
jgi:hypothetical protein